jgi:hypothetical protein
LDRGLTAVYGHLDGFSDRIESLVASRQCESGDYEQDIYLWPNEISVERGDTLGYSGDTGASSGPHLHFELRQGETALNPLLAAYSVADGTRPVLNYVRLVPVGSGSEIDGRDSPCVVRLRGGRARGVWEGARIPRIDGSFYVSVSAFDRSAGASSRLAVYQTKLFLDDSLLFESRFDGIEDSLTQEVELAYDLGLARDGERFTLNLCRFDGSRMRALQGLAPRAGVVDVEKSGLSGQHTLRVEASDVAGNTSTAILRFVAGSRPSVDSVGFSRNGRILSVEASVSSGRTDLERVWLQYRLGAGSAKPVKLFLSRKASQTGALSGASSGANSNAPYGASSAATYACDVRLPPTLAGGSTQGLVGTFRVSAQDEQGFVSAPYTAGYVEGDWPSRATVRLEVERQTDFADIRARVTPQFLRPRIGVVARDTVWLKVVEEPDGLYRARLRFSHAFSTGGTAVCVVEEDGRRLASASQTINLRLCRKGTNGTVESGDAGAAFRHGTETFYGDTYISIERTKPGSLPAGLSFVSDVFSFQPADVVFDKPGSVVIRCPDEALASGKAGVYRRNSGSRWSYVGAASDASAKTLEAQVRVFSDFALIKDEVPPSIGAVRPRNGRVTSGGRPRILAVVRDVGSGVEWKGMTVSIDGKKALSVWEPRYSRLSVVHTAPLSPGRHRAVFEIRDRAGNLSVAETSFRVSR